jgi:hypothetical protein
LCSGESSLSAINHLFNVEAMLVRAYDLLDAIFGKLAGWRAPPAEAPQ